MTTALAPVARLPEEFRQNAAAARRLAGSDAAAHVWEEAARETERRLQEAMLEPLTLDQAELESGYTKRHLMRMIREGVLPDSRAEDATQAIILRCHLPRKPGFGFDAEEVRPASSRAQAARAVIGGGRR